MAIPSSTQPRTRYYEVAPEYLSVPAADLLARLPAEYRNQESGNPEDRKLELPCRELFRGNTPRLPLGLLRDLCPDLVRLPEGTDPQQQLPLPAGWLALHFQLITRSEELPPDPEMIPKPETVPEEPKSASLEKEEHAPPGKSDEVSPEAAASLPPLLSPSSSPLQPQEEKPPVPATKEGDPKTSHVEESQGAEAPTESDKAEPSQPAREAATLPPVAEAPAPVSGEKRKGFFASLPIFRRHQPSEKPPQPEGKIPTPTPAGAATLTRELPPVPPNFEIRRKREAVVPPPEIPSPEIIRPEEPNIGIKSDEPPKTESPKLAVPLTLERLWKLDPHDQLADPAALQSLFMTEEKLTLERVVALAGQLPGLRACVLAHGHQVLCSSGTPTGIDLHSLSSQAMTMLSRIRESSASMGLGAVPAITLHAEQGILSFLHQGELCLLVLHADRGFVPGVRERLQEMLGHLAQAQALPGSSSTQPSLPI